MDRRLKKDARIQLFKKKTYHFNVKYIGFYFNKKKKNDNINVHIANYINDFIQTKNILKCYLKV